MCMAIMFFTLSVYLYLCLCIFSILIILSWCLVGEGGPRATMIASTGGIIFVAVGENQPLWAKIDFALLFRSGMHFLRANQTCSANFCLKEKLNFLSISDVPWCQSTDQNLIAELSKSDQYISPFVYIRNCICTVYKSVFVYISIFICLIHVVRGSNTSPNKGLNPLCRESASQQKCRNAVMKSSSNNDPVTFWSE